MKKENNLILVFSGTEMAVNLLKEELEENEIAAMIQNDFQSGLSAGFFGGGPSAIDLFIQEEDLEKAEPIINAFKQNDKTY
jgi:hypothetical protein